MTITVTRRVGGALDIEQVAKSMDQFGLRVRLPDGRTVAGAELKTIDLSRWHIDRSDIWMVLRDAAGADNEGQILDLSRPDVTSRFALSDGVDGNYPQQVLDVGTRVVFLQEATRLNPADLQRPPWWRQVLDFLAEVFTLTLVRTWTYNAESMRTTDDV